MNKVFIPYKRPLEREIEEMDWFQWAHTPNAVIPKLAPLPHVIKRNIIKRLPSLLLPL